MQSQIYRIMADRSGKPLRQIIRDTKRTDFYLDAAKAKEYGLIDDILGQAAPPIVEAQDSSRSSRRTVASSTERLPWHARCDTRVEVCRK